jgi:hypothetical protein
MSVLRFILLFFVAVPQDSKPAEAIAATPARPVQTEHAYRQPVLAATPAAVPAARVSVTLCCVGAPVVLQDRLVLTAPVRQPAHPTTCNVALPAVHRAVLAQTGLVRGHVRAVLTARFAVTIPRMDCMAADQLATTVALLGPLALPVLFVAMQLPATRPAAVPMRRVARTAQAVGVAQIPTPFAEL